MIFENCEFHTQIRYHLFKPFSIVDEISFSPFSPFLTFTLKRHFSPITQTYHTLFSLNLNTQPLLRSKLHTKKPKPFFLFTLVPFQSPPSPSSLLHAVDRTSILAVVLYLLHLRSHRFMFSLLRRRWSCVPPHHTLP